MTSLQANEVFIPGGQPRATYVKREALGLEDELRRYLYGGNRLLSVTGPTKSGKTVLCRTVLPAEEHVWVNGGDVHSEQDLWTSVGHQIAAKFVQDESVTVTRNEGSSQSGSMGLNLPPATTKVEQIKNKLVQLTEHRHTGKFVDLKRQCIEHIVENKIVLIIDDFHYIVPSVQSNVIRALKGPIFDGLKSIILAVPHRAYDAERVENEMTGRVGHLPIPLWEDEDLKKIADHGFPLLNTSIGTDTLDKFVTESYRSPHLMQEFCLRLCLDNEIFGQVENHKAIGLESDHAPFFRSIGRDTAKPAFDRLARGPRQRTDRLQREFKNGGRGDIYLAVLHSLALTGPKTEIRYEEIRQALREILKNTIPQMHEITRVLIKMTEIAREQIQGEPVIDWDEENKLLHIVDPFFAFYLRWRDPATLT